MTTDAKHEQVENGRKVFQVAVEHGSGLSALTDLGSVMLLSENQGKDAIRYISAASARGFAAALVEMADALDAEESGEDE